MKSYCIFTKLATQGVRLERERATVKALSCKNALALSLESRSKKTNCLNLPEQGLRCPSTYLIYIGQMTHTVRHPEN